MSEKIKDYATGKKVSLTSEEIARQDYEHILIDELKYPKDYIDINFPIQRGSKRHAEKADIIVFKTLEHDQKNAYIVVETESPGKKFDDQVFSYATATTAEFVVWFDGLNPRKSQGAKCYWRDLAKDPTKFVKIPHLPHYGETLAEVGKYYKGQLVPARSLKRLFQKMHNRLYGEGPLKREESIAQEVIKLIFCKIYDELYTPGERCEFRATVKELGTGEGREVIASRIRQLYQAMKKEPEFADMFEEDIQYDSYWISYIVSELQRFALLHPETDTDALGDAYEIFIGPQLKGESGQFFTPRAVVHMAVEMLRPSITAREYLIDPACGSGGFLIYAMRYIVKEARKSYRADDNRINALVADYARNFIVGIDIEPLLHKVAKSYMAIVGNGRSEILCEDTLLPPPTWIVSTQAKAQLGKFHVLLTNPPFGTKIKVQVPETLRQFDLGHILEDGKPTNDIVRDGQDPALLFLERCWQFLRDPVDGRGGRMAIVLPRQVTSGHHCDMMNIRKWILEHMKILAVVDLPRETFQPYCGTLTSLLFAERVKEPVTSEYNIFMAVADTVGHDRRGNPHFLRTENGEIIYDKDKPVIENDLPLISSAYDEYSKGKRRFDSEKPSIFSINVSDILRQPRLRIDAWFYDPFKNKIAKHIWDLDDSINDVKVKTIGEITTDVFYPPRHRRNYVKPGPDAVPFLSGTNILQVRPFDVKWQHRFYKPIQKHFIEKDWILVTRSGSIGRVIYVGDDIAGFPVNKGVAVSEHVIRIAPDSKEVDPGYLFAYLSTENIGRVLLAQGIYASVVEHITPQHVESIPIPLPDPDIQKAIGDRVREAEKLRSRARLKTKALQDGLENSISNRFTVL